jgi:hypothetical protein
LLDKLAAVEGSKAVLFSICEKLPLPTVKQQIIKLVNIHLDDDVNLCVLVRLDASDTLLRANKVPDTILQERKEFLGLKQQTLSVVAISNSGCEHELAEVDVHEELRQERVEVACVR